MTMKCSLIDDEYNLVSTVGHSCMYVGLYMYLFMYACIYLCVYILMCAYTGISDYLYSS